MVLGEKKTFCFQNTERLINYNIDRLKKSKSDFTIERSTTITEIVYAQNGTLFRRKYLNPNESSTNNISNVCSDVIRDIQKFCELNEVPIARGEAITMDYNPALISCINPGATITEIDVSACYWNIAYRKRYISKNTYYKYLDDKDARLIGLGNLAKVKVVDEYKKGIFNRRYSIKSSFSEFFYAIVHEMARIYTSLNNFSNGYPVFHFKTDAFYIFRNKSVESFILAVLKNNGLHAKVKYHTVKSVDSHMIRCSKKDILYS